MTMAAIQTALYSRLTSWPALATVPIYDHVPQDATPESNEPFPFITIGEDSHENWDTDTETGLESLLRVHVWSRHEGRLEARQIQDDIRAALNRHKLAVPGCNTVILDMESAEVQRIDDGQTYHGIQEFRLLLEEL